MILLLKNWILNFVKSSFLDACHGRGIHHSFELDGKLLRATGIQISQVDERSEDAEEKKLPNRFFR